MKKQSPEKYSNYIFLMDKDKNYRLVVVSCLKDYCSVIDKTKGRGFILIAGFSRYLSNFLYRHFAEITYF
ncbi:TPA: hypothetical protein RZK55_001663 [Campylobacter jejuni]|nr:hypothetical protein [Campylobacter jejuni]